MTADSGSLQRLLAVQDNDRDIDALVHRRLTLPQFEDLEQLGAERQALEGEAELVQGDRHELERAQKRLEDEVAMLEDRTAQENAKLYGGDVTGMKDLQALQDEISGLKERQRLVEDQILEVMETAEPFDTQLAVFATKMSALDQRADELRASIDQEQDAIDAEKADTEGRRAEVAGGLSAELIEDYDNLRSQPGRVGVARLVGRTCHGCHLELSAVEVDRLRKLPADELVHCDECGCILVR
jgi:predicted  nucleic acid-binding Zn-ribbon protein